MSYDRNEAINDKLRQLGRMGTVSPFFHTFYQLIAQYACSPRSSARYIGDLFAQFLNAEFSYHRRLDRATQQEGLKLGDVYSLADKHRIALDSLADEALTTSGRSRDDELARQLILATCYYHTSQTEKVVAHLEAALRHHGDERLIYFALGYNRYMLALEAFVRPAEEPGEWLISDYIRFQEACPQVASAFEEVLTGSQSDAEVYQWISRVLASAGLHQAGEQALSQAKEATPDQDSDSSRQDPYPPAPPGDQFISAQSFVDLRPISTHEIGQVRKLLKASFSISDLWPEDDPDLQDH